MKPYLSLIGEAPEEALAGLPVQHLELLVVDAVLLPDVLPTVQRGAFFVHPEVTSSPLLAHGSVIGPRAALTPTLFVRAPVVL